MRILFAKEYFKEQVYKFNMLNGQIVIKYLF